MGDALGVSLSTARLYVLGGPDVAVLRDRWTTLTEWQPRSHVTGVGVLRRLQALVALGYTPHALAARAGVYRMTFIEGLNDDRTLWKVPVRDAVLDLYAELWQTPPQPTTRWERAAVTRAKNLAAERGYVPPLAWDAIDDPQERPHMERPTDAIDPVVVERILAGDCRLPASKAEKAEVIARWTGTDNELERLTGWNVARERRHMEGRAA
jgi:hypothetical protein